MYRSRLLFFLSLWLFSHVISFLIFRWIMMASRSLSNVRIPQINIHKEVSVDTNSILSSYVLFLQTLLSNFTQGNCCYWFLRTSNLVVCKVHVHRTSNSSYVFTQLIFYLRIDCVNSDRYEETGHQTGEIDLMDEQDNHKWWIIYVPCDDLIKINKWRSRQSETTLHFLLM